MAFEDDIALIPHEEFLILLGLSLQKRGTKRWNTVLCERFDCWRPTRPPFTQTHARVEHNGNVRPLERGSTVRSSLSSALVYVFMEQSCMNRMYESDTLFLAECTGVPKASVPLDSRR